MLYDPGARMASWQVITDDTIRSTGQGWRLDVPLSNTLDVTTTSALRALATGDDSYVQALNVLRVDRSWMVPLQDGGTAHVEVDEWINKTSGRGEFHLVGAPADGSEVTTRERTGYFGFAEYADVLPLIGPWADLGVDADVYDMHDESVGPRVRRVRQGIRLVHRPRRAVRRVARAANWPALRPYEIAGGGEIAHWRLELTLNDLGSAFLIVAPW